MIASNSDHYIATLSQIDLADTYIKQLFDYYHQSFLSNDWACMFVESSPSIPEDLREHSFPCLCNRSISTQVTSRRTLQGGAIRGSLQRNKLLLDSGGELFRGCVVFPEQDDTGKIISATGYRYAKRIRTGQHSVVQWHCPAPDYLVSQDLLAIQEVIHEKTH